MACGSVRAAPRLTAAAPASGRPGGRFLSSEGHRCYSGLSSLGPYNTPRTNSVKLVASGTVRLSWAPKYRFGVRFTLLSCSPCTHAALAAQAGSALRRHAPCPRRPAYCCSRGRFRGLCPRPARSRCPRAVLRLKGYATCCGAALLRASFLQLTARHDALSGWQRDLQRALRAAGVCARWRCAHCFPTLFA